MDSNLSSLLITAQDIQDIIRGVGLDSIMDKLIERTYSTFLHYSEEAIQMPIRSGFSYNEPVEGLIEWMPLRNLPEDHILIKVVAYHPDNPTKKDLPTIISNIAKYDCSTGHLIAIMDGVLPTSLRTGAASAVASKIFAYPESKTLGLIGCGAQSITQLHALSRVFEIEKVVYFDIDPTTMNSFKERSSILGLESKFEGCSIDEVVRSSDILSTATSIGVGEGPLFQYKTTKDWLHVNAIGSDFVGKTELPKELLLKSFVSPDFLEQAVKEGESQQLEPHQIGEGIIHCIKKANKYNYLKEQLTVFDSTGIPLEDQVVADLFLDYAKEMNLGTKVQLENTFMEMKNPYSFMFKMKH